MEEIIMKCGLDKLEVGKKKEEEEEEMEVNMFSGWIEEDMWEKIKRIMEKRSGEKIVKDKIWERLVGNMWKGGNVDDLECRVRRDLKKNEIGIGEKGRFKVGKIREVDDRELKEIERKEGLEDIKKREEEGEGRDEMIERM